MKDKPMNEQAIKCVIIDRDSLPSMHPTNSHDPKFWEQLGRTIATYGFLEEVLGKAIFALTATKKYEAGEIDAALEKWQSKLEKALFDQLSNLADSFGKAARDNSDMKTKDIDELVKHIKKAAEIRNVLCHASWPPPNSNGGVVPLFINRKKEIFVTEININWLENVQKSVSDLAYDVMDSVTSMGWQFPGGSGPGKPIV